MNAFNIVRVPDTTRIYGENGLVENGSIDFRLDDKSLVPILRADEPVKKVILKWWEKIDNENTLFYGDHFERGYGDLCWRGLEPERKMFWYFLSSNEVVTKGYGVKTSPNAVCIWTVENDSVTLELDTCSGSYGVNLGKRMLELCTIIEYEGEQINKFLGDCRVLEPLVGGSQREEASYAEIIENQTDDVYQIHNEFCKKMCDKPVLFHEPIYGANTWYNTYGFNLTEDVVNRYTDELIELARDMDVKPFMVIDDGWQVGGKYSGSPYEVEVDGEMVNSLNNGGPWLPHTKFGDMKMLADSIKARGARPGIWTRPLLSAFEVEEELLIDGNKGEKLGAYVYDPTHPKVLKMVGEDVARITGDWGFELLKFDFTTYDIYGLWGFEMVAGGSPLYKGDGLQNPNRKIRFYDDSITTVEAIKNLYKVIADNKGQGAIIMGCNTVSHLSAGVFEAYRTGDDTSGFDFDRTRKMGVNVLAHRLPQHNTFYGADADCIGIKTLPEGIEWEQNREWLKLLAKSGTPLFYSADFEALTKDVKEEIKDAFKVNVEAGKKNLSSISEEGGRVLVRPLDFKFRTYPERFDFAGEKLEFNWYK